MTELSIQLNCFEKLKKSIQYDKVLMEVPFGPRCIDLIYVTHENEIVSIEFKLDKWREAIEQASDHLCGVDKSYICLPEKKYSQKLYDAIDESEVGLMFYNSHEDYPFEIIRPAVKSKRYDRLLRKLLEKMINLVYVEEMNRI